MPQSRLQHQRSTRDKSQIWLSLQDKTLRSNRWRAAILLLATIIGGVIGYFSLPREVSDVVDSGYSLSAEGVRVFAVLGGSGVCLLLVIWLGAVIQNIDIRKSRRALFWCTAGILTVAIVGAMLGYFFLPGLLLAPIRVLFGAIIGLIGLAMLVSMIQDPKVVLSELDVSGCLEGCFSLHFVFFIALIGMISGLLIWRTMLLGVLAGGGSALMTVIIFGSLRRVNRKEEIFHGSKASAPTSHSADSA